MAPSAVKSEAERAAGSKLSAVSILTAHRHTRPSDMALIGASAKPKAMVPHTAPCQTEPTPPGPTCILGFSWIRRWVLPHSTISISLFAKSDTPAGSMMNGLQTLPQWRTFFDSPEGAVLGLMNAVYPLGKVISLPLVAFISDRFGRKIPLIVGLAACVAFAIMQAMAQNFGTFVAARALLGFSTSFISQPSPIIVAELAYPPHRGKVTALYNTFYVSSLISCLYYEIAKLSLVFRLHLCCVVYLWHLQDRQYLELANPIPAPGCHSCASTISRVVRSRIS